ncbi:MAG: Leucine-tRNA ligase [Candidatus Yanofskybacteria bacterium GW2011_GWF1_44_227]|uniref:Leucine--tRNA ligase n=1 Tax=Candidatus Yanofskybacteria bacterium GW2011_GWE2_40_11 TaxID=1619033 RepID=A0A0G0QHX8_9BACT|nr:MAG: Leucine-tRNA ligase [Candidatus Yanofskybacteria bacterium GW2011_GWE2_40_11]KKT14645.1 MAG: Leucine-tRNA ligase [Candidatus Yanofskybacteria bacterium GW2011_GWF2_43_596]KKT53032.1 MAG: Leucine-tRNA ligase [Candidatus Yanofskybacteria bacterium GW2011_GWF1_44_227]OGN35714.1 MAG: leucine--tRNA ligase [Candidatus Yanofskybacteria bacterium RIFOXYA2_FULL_45_28]OGN35752.1 MAG: leucine--tRNA ligase [Candidatus Yanofskybacteria bacterium RIFOXYA1_FULL_44_17]OGN37048.1 MAG: leucine--tRNA lig
MKKYNPGKIEKKWQKYWEKEKMHEAVAGANNHLLLVEFPYPSGNLHIGHWYAFALPDILARYERMNGKNVMYPIGFDAFGLPAENAAIQRETSPGDWTKKNIAYMTKQLRSMGATFDWSRQVETIDSEYYKWTQWMFLKFYEKDLSYRAETPVNWCSKDKTVLANEQVVNGKCDRCGTDVEQRKLSQWMFRITKFADDLVDGLDRVDWPETTKLAQRNWIGRSEGSMISFKIKDFNKSIEVFTTRADTLFGATYVVLAPENELVKDLKPFITNWDEVEKYITEAKRKSELERMTNVKSKTGAQLKGVVAINPINGEEVSVWVADYVLAHYGTGAVMAVPAHDQRDYDFAKKHGIAIVGVVSPTYFEGHVSVSANPMEHLKKLISDISSGELCYEGDGLLMSSGKYTGIGSEEARTKIVEELKSKGLGRLIKQYRLHDWILSRQRYWGVPIPIIKCTECGYVPVPEKDLPIKLPKLDDFKPSDDGRSPLAKSGKWLKAKCPKCGGEAERETDTMDTFVDSSWYFMRYADPNNKGEFASQENMDAWLPVPLYVGGAEHNTMHLLYSRFFTKALHSLGYVKFDEPFLGRVNHGIILGPDGQKMSKSRGNVVDPDVEVKNYGADTVRMYLSFMGPYEQGGPWDPKGINGVSRFLNRIWNFVSRHEDKKLKVYEKPEIDVEIARAIKNVGGDIKELKFNTGVSGLMKMLNSLEEITGEEYKLSKEQYELILKVVAPYAPHIAEELWQEVLGNEKSIHLESWPKFDETLLKEESFNLVIQINGKVRDAILMKAGLPEDEVKKLVMANEKIQKYIDGQVIKKFIYIQGRVANIVI